MSAPGIGGIIVRDSIGGEQFQYRTSDSIGGFSRVVLYRKAPADGTFHVTLGLAGYGEAYFDDFRVQVIEEDPRFETPDRDPDLVRGPRRRTQTPSLPNPGLPAESALRSNDARRQQR